jgi:glycerol-3-phosphate acyltransferase PlsY
MLSTTILLKLLAGLAAGAVPFAVIAMWGTGIDITRAGSGNPGFNNVWRVSSFGRGLFTLAGDISKGGLAVALLTSAADPVWLGWGVGLAAVVGHCWNPLLRFNGGKGVATMAGVLICLEPWITVPSLALYPTLRFFGRRMGWAQEGAVSSMTTMAVIVLAVFWLRDSVSAAFAFMGWVIVVVRHVPNLREIFRRD